jgi:ABC-type Fe3+-siderophore transport system permease subunit
MIKNNKGISSPVIIIPLLILIVLLLAIISLGVGAVFISPDQVITALIGTGAENHLFILENYRLPRILLACLVGAGLAVSGAILQGIIRNPLASPDVIGITKGAGLAAAIVLILFPKSPVYMLPIAAFMGAATVAVLLFVFAYKQGAQPATLALVGIALGAICQAGIQYLMIRFPVDVNAALIWLTGSLWGRGWEQVMGLVPWFIVLFPLVFILAAKLDVLNLGDDVAEGLGENVKRVRYLLLAVAVSLAGVCVAVVGSIGFVGLIAPHMARRLIGARHRLMLPVSASFGAMLILISDGLGRGLVPPIEIPAGIITAVIGAPYFLYLLQQERRQR